MLKFFLHINYLLFIHIQIFCSRVFAPFFYWDSVFSDSWLFYTKGLLTSDLPCVLETSSPDCLIFNFAFCWHLHFTFAHLSLPSFILWLLVVSCWESLTHPMRWFFFPCFRLVLSSLTRPHQSLIHLTFTLVRPTHFTDASPFTHQFSVTFSMNSYYSQAYF